MTNIALLAPVPAALLEDAVSEGKTTVAFGSMAWGFFQALADDYPGEELDALIYASHTDGSSLHVAWKARYLRWSDAIEAEADSAFMRDLRSKLAHSDWAGNDAGGRWAVYWIVDGLHRLTNPIPMADLRLPNGQRLSAAFIPHGPTRIRSIA